MTNEGRLKVLGVFHALFYAKYLEQANMYTFSDTQS